MARFAAGALLLVPSALACAANGDLPEPGDGNGSGEIGQIGQRVSLLNKAYCQIKVTGKGWVDTENDYLPHVIACENGGANLQALKAQAVAARSVAYYNMASQGSICDGQGCQVYSCGAKPQAIHYQAVAETAQLYLAYNGMLTYGFYVAGDSNAASHDCYDVNGATSHYVTYNDGKTGTSVKQTKLGWVGPPGFGQNRGCMSQWGARCLEAYTNRDWAGLLRFYYGADIELTVAPGDCGAPGGPAQPSGPSCGNGACESGEDCSSCPVDCGACPAPPPAPSPGGPEPAAGECSGACGKQAPSGCGCDAACAGYGDCCTDGSACSVCGNCGGSSEPPPSNPPPPTNSCTATGHQGSGENGQACSDPAETWRCVYIPSFGTWGSQVCRYGVWNTFHLNPKSCADCCGDYSTSCSQ